MGEVIADKVKSLVLIGQTGKKIDKALKDEIERTGKGSDIPVTYSETLKDAVDSARKNAKSGDIVILSPASASFDMFKNFAERGDMFKDIVNGL